MEMEPEMVMMIVLVMVMMINSIWSRAAHEVFKVWTSPTSIAAKLSLDMATTQITTLKNNTTL